MQYFGTKPERDNLLLYELPGFSASREHSLVAESEGPSLGTWKLRATKKERVADSPTPEEALRAEARVAGCCVSSRCHRPLPGDECCGLTLLNSSWPRRSKHCRTWLPCRLTVTCFSMRSGTLSFQVEKCGENAKNYSYWNCESNNLYPAFSSVSCKTSSVANARSHDIKCSLEERTFFFLANKTLPTKKSVAKTPVYPKGAGSAC